MAVGARDYIDRLLVQKYGDLKVDNHDSTPSMVNPNEMMRAMNDYAAMHRTMLNLQQNLQSACKKLYGKTNSYKGTVIEDENESFENYQQEEEAAAC